MEAVIYLVRLATLDPTLKRLSDKGEDMMEAAMGWVSLSIPETTLMRSLSKGRMFRGAFGRPSV